MSPQDTKRGRAATKNNNQTSAFPDCMEETGDRYTKSIVGPLQPVSPVQIEPVPVYCDLPMALWGTGKGIYLIDPKDPVLREWKGWG